jgi:hypothetical protein
VLRRALVLVLSIVAFLAISAGLARIFSAGNDERDLTVGLIKAQARGDTPGVLARLPGCRASQACRTRMTAQVASLRTLGKVKVLRVDMPSTFTLGSRTAQARIVWEAGRRLSTVQCVRLRRAGDPVSGFEVRALALSAPIGRESSCAG